MSAPAPYESLSLLASDGRRVPADLFRPTGPARAAVLLAPAMGVPRRFYRAFGAFLAEGGLEVVSVDYRGIGDAAPDSLRGFQATLHDWAELDLRAGLDWLRERHRDLPLLWVGHSVGGQLLGWMERPPVDRALFVASQSGHWRQWSGVPRAGMFFLWHAFIPASVRLTGRLPMKAIGQGEDVPAGVALQWAQWGRHRRYLAGFTRPGNGLETFGGSLRAYAISDDGFAPPRSVRALVDEFRTPHKEYLLLQPRDLGLKKLGHFGAFRPAARQLWGEIREWLLEDEATRARSA